MNARFSLIDVFHDGAFTGNPLAVVSGAEPDTATMQTMARWFNLSETVFLLPPTNPDADYRARIFTLAHELPFAGHPTLGACHAWLGSGGRPRRPGRIVQECGAGLVPIRQDGDRLAFAGPPLLREGPVDAATMRDVVSVLRIAPDTIVEARWADNGPGWVGVMLASAEEVLAVEPVRRHEGRIDIGLVGAHAPGSEVAWEIRTLFSDGTGALIEDPVTGSFNAAVAAWLRETGRATGPYVAAQGTKLGRRGRIFVDYDGADWIGGRTLTVAEGILPLDL
ncbi:PhzF family phenazine biosynthesis protein [Methylobacterium nonmethylotrophicum]|uniref:PhzF family phenazine biosynthesis protein n=1 Tax=Methylobacterium nonmethylotrophicum TaxID=1141884 RepID=A0A4Z0NVA2_9HYPH|nr:PhzF family phenazine biosynthesis protein [Methylobacterium nonmethylotrophicum]TGE01213.1 PhzF family phenazine biosynthesis protein [Methylobacterium nonmethylotrophicum]